ncbi:MAG: FtsQ-type POTRA domain-containing protein [Firmicutes bacterium]|nr:FtsQ-type POTRA domain-containing protein [Bacillota bacterium]
MAEEEIIAAEAEAPAEQVNTEPAKPRKKKKRRKKHYFLRFLVLCAIVAGVIYGLKSEFFNVTEIVVEGNSYYTAAQITEMSGLKTGINLFDQKTKPAKEALLADPYIKVVKISRIPRGTFKIVVEERTEYACLPYGDEYVLIDDTGMVLRIIDNQQTLPVIEGMTLTEMTPGKALGVEQSYLLTNTLELLRVMHENDIFFKRISLSKVMVKAYIYDELYCEGKPENITANMAEIKQLAEELYGQDIVRGVIKVGKDNYLTYSPKFE